MSAATDLQFVEVPWVSAIFPALHKKPPSSASLVQRVYQNLGVFGNPEREAAGQRNRSQLINAKTYDQLAERCFEAFYKLGLGPRPPLTPLELKTAHFLAVGLRHLLPVNQAHPEKVTSLLSELNARYFALPYHHAGHAANATHDAVLLTKALGLWGDLKPSETTAFVVAALGHDVGHPGRNQQYFRKTNHPLNVLYNSQSMLENYHCSTLLQILQTEPCSILSSPDNVAGIPSHIRRLIVQCILWTDLGEHDSLMSEAALTLKFAKRNGRFLNDSNFLRTSLALCLKGGDLGYLAHNSPQGMLQWIIDYYEEVFVQVAAEVQLGYPQPKDELTFQDLGSSQWFEKNASFGTQFVVPLGHLLMSFEKGIKQSKGIQAGDNQQLPIPSSPQPTQGTPRRSGSVKRTGSTSELMTATKYRLGNLDYNLNFLRAQHATDIDHLCSKLADAHEEEILDVGQRKSGGWINKFASWKETHEEKTRKSAVFWLYMQPLEKNIKALRNGKYTTDLRHTPNGPI